MSNDILPREIMLRLECIQEADIVIGIDYQDSSMENVIHAIALGLAKYFPELKAVLIKFKQNPEDNSDQIFLRTDPYEKRELSFIDTPIIPVHRILIETEENIDRKGFLRQVFYIADILNCDACMILSGDMESINPEWVEALLSPVIKSDYDYISPVYISHKHDATITTNLVYPLTRILYNIELLYPIGGDYGISIDLVRTCLEKNVWDIDMDIDVWMTTTAVGEGFEIGQAFLGSKCQEGKYTISHMGDKFVKVLASIVSLLNIYRDLLSNYDNRSKEVPTFAFPYNLFPKPVNLSAKEIMSEGKKTYKKTSTLVKKILAEKTFKQLEDALLLKENKICFIHDDLWVKIIFDYISYFNTNEKDHTLLYTITPLYLFRIASFVEETSEMSEKEVAGRINLMCDKFEDLKEYLYKAEDKL